MNSNVDRGITSRTRVIDRVIAALHPTCAMACLLEDEEDENVFI